MPIVNPLQVTDLPDAARADLLQGAAVPVEDEGVRVATIVPDRARESRLLSLAGIWRYEGRLDVEDVDAALGRRRG